ncbi:unnamed protein product [Heterobilharzia americana]|nr:unnamed protein product [Heterobilharzia americana]
MIKMMQNTTILYSLRRYKDFKEIKLLNDKQAKKMLFLIEKVNAYKRNFHLLLNEFEKQKNLQKYYKKNHNETVEKCVQTDMIRPCQTEIERLKSMNLDIFTHGVLEVAFQLHEKLSQCHGRRRLEIKYHEKHASELSRTHMEILKRVQEKQYKNLTEFKYRIQKSTQQELDLLRKERGKLLNQLNEIRKVEQQTRHTNSLLKLQIYNLEKRLQTYEVESYK